MYWQTFFYIPIQKTKPLSESDLNALTLGELYLMREACSHANAIEGFQIKNPTKPQDTKPKPKTLEEFRQYLHQEKGFSKVVSRD